MGLPKKFSFDVSFDHLEGANRRRGPERRFSRAEFDAARQAALAEGRAAGIEEAAQSAAAKTADALAAIANGVAALIAAQDATAAETERRAIAALQAIIAKSFPALAAKDPLGEIETFAIKCLHEAIDEPRVVLRVANEIYEPLRERLDAVAAASGYAGRIVLLADDALAPGNASVEWADGGAERDPAGQSQIVAEALERRRDPAASPDPISPEEMKHE